MNQKKGLKITSAPVNKREPMAMMVKRGRTNSRKSLISMIIPDNSAFLPGCFWTVQLPFLGSCLLSLPIGSGVSR